MTARASRRTENSAFVKGPPAPESRDYYREGSGRAAAEREERPRRDHRRWRTMEKRGEGGGGGTKLKKASPFVGAPRAPRDGIVDEGGRSTAQRRGRRGGREPGREATKQKKREDRCSGINQD